MTSVGTLESLLLLRDSMDNPAHEKPRQPQAAMTVLLDVDIDQVPRSELPALLGRLVELEARVRLRLAEIPVATAPPPVNLVDAARAAEIAGTSKRWILWRTRGMQFRRDLSRVKARFDEAGLRRWITERRRP